MKENGISLFRIKPALLFLFSVLFSCLTYSQEATSYYYENELDFALPLAGKWSMEVGLGNRGLLQERFDGEKVSGYAHEHIELNHFTNYRTSESVVLSLGFRYRFRELFEDAATDEFRIIEQVSIQPSNSSFSHRFRVEQRFRENTIHRLRYNLGYTVPMGQNYTLGLGAEALYAVSTQLKPEAEQRFSIGIETDYFQDLELGLSLQYRMENYTRDLAHEIFLITGIAVSL